MNVATEISLLDADKVDLPSLYGTSKLDEVVSEIEATVRSQVLTAETRQGREAITSLAYKVSRSKTALDNAGKEHTEDLRKMVRAVDQERRTVRERLDALRDETRKPLVEWEAKDQIRLDALQARLDAITDGGLNWQSSTAEINDKLDEINAIKIDDSWQEKEALAETRKTEVLTSLQKAYDMAFAREQQAAEAARLRAEKEEMERQNAAREAELAELRAKEAAREQAERDREAEIEALRAENAAMKEAPAKVAEPEPEAPATDTEAEDPAPEETLADPAPVEREEPAPAAAVQPSEFDRTKAVLADIATAISKFDTAALPIAMLRGQIPHVTVTVPE